MLTKLIRRCLQKARTQRLRDIGDASADLDEAFDPESADDTTVAVVDRPSGQRTLALVAVAALVVGVFAGLAGSSLRPPSQQRSVARFALTLPLSDRLFRNNIGPVVALSSDGETLIYDATRDGVRQFYRRPLDQLEALPIPGTEGAGYPFLSPDDEWIGFVANGVLRKISVNGGPPATLYDGPLSVSDASWGTNDMIVFGTSGDNQPLLGVPATGGATEAVTTLEDGEIDHRHPELLPGQTGLLFVVVSENQNDRIAVKALETGERRFLLGGSSPRYVSGGVLTFVRENAVWAVRFDPDTLELTGDPTPVLDGIEIGSTGVAQYWVAQNGSLVYVPAFETDSPKQLVWVDRSGNEEPISAEPRPYHALRLSPDGRRIVVEVHEADNIDLVVYDLTLDTTTRLTSDPAPDSFPVWTPDGDRIVFASSRDGALNLYSRAADGTGEVERLTTSEHRQRSFSFSPDGQTLMFAEATSGIHIARLSMDGDREGEWLLEGDLLGFHPEISPDGRWLAHTSLDRQVYVRPFPNVGDGRWQISPDGGIMPMWEPNGDELFYMHGSGALMVVDVDTDPTFSRGQAALVFEGPYRGTLAANNPRAFDISPDGKRFLMIKDPTALPSASQIILVQNWFEELTRLVPTE